MKTASYFTYFGEGRIGISRGQPRRCPAGYRLYRTLAPVREMINWPYPEYRERFFGEILAPLDPRKEFDKLHELANGAEPVLLCFEKPPFHENNWCHRRMVAEWFHDTLGIVVPEIELERAAGAAPAASRG